LKCYVAGAVAPFDLLVLVEAAGVTAAPVLLLVLSPQASRAIMMIAAPVTRLNTRFIFQSSSILF
jgi:hypothetical protein